MNKQSDYINRLCKSLVRKHGTNDPFELAEALGVHVEFDNIGAVKGYYCYMNRIRMIAINRELNNRFRRFVCGHELGHDLLNRNRAIFSPLKDIGFTSTARHEVEANSFAASLLVREDEFLELASCGYTDEQISAALGIHVELVRIKSNLLRQSGIQLRIQEMPTYDFLGIL
ncbi:ImmA/IrrE family metallo-endopeptidase [Christensenellaceae bacterium OttesenSCG-928-K19]|nr:ImmA/IrrE family metallo-endopeptidase [Christensenellaceae bacterium OttesenSCG-928-K19]